MLFGLTGLSVYEGAEVRRVDPQFPLFAPVQLFSLRFLNRRKRRVSNGGIGELFFGRTGSFVYEGAGAMRGTPQFPLFAPVQFFSQIF